MSPIVDLVINAAISGREDEFARALEARAAREQHWAGRAGKGGDVRPSSGIHEVMLNRGGEMCDRLMSERGWSEVDFRYAAKRLEISGDPDLETLGRHLRAFEVYAAEQAEKGMARDMNTTESMTRQLIAGQSEEYLREQRTPVDRPAAPGRHPRQRGWMPYPTNVRPVAEPDVDPDRAARGATQPAMSQALRSFAKGVAGLARLSSNARQRNRLLQRAAELERMSVKQCEREGASEVIPSDDPDEANNTMSKLASDMRDEARANGAQDGDFDSFDSWADPGEDRAGSEQRAEGDVDQQLEDVPKIPQPGRRLDEDQLADPGLHADEPRGLRRNRPRDPDSKRTDADLAHADPTPNGQCSVCRKRLDTAGPKCGRCSNRACLG